ncbi:hypothetical protein EV401DRAFT_1914100 [Pisolithus croceorrhizus]|nr:hypothetical protein EV401DRAFT_1914100 [Pisolithus croceorrhizus]
MMDTGRTLTPAARPLHDKDVKTIRVLISYGLFAEADITALEAATNRRAGGHQDMYHKRRTKRSAQKSEPSTSARSLLRVYSLAGISILSCYEKSNPLDPSPYDLYAYSARQKYR